MIIVTLKDGYTYLTDNPNSENFKENLLLNNIDVVEEPVAPLSKTIPATILIISIFAIFITSFLYFNLNIYSNYHAYIFCVKQFD